MTKFVTMVMVVAFMLVYCASALADGWKMGNWEPPTKAPVLKAVAFVAADWGAPVSPVVQSAVVSPAGCSGMVQHTHAEPAQRAGCNGRGGRWFLGKRIMANRKARALARMGSAHVISGS